MTMPFDAAIADKNVRERWSDLAVHLRSADVSINGMRTTPVYERTSPSMSRDSYGRFFLTGRKQPAYRYFDLDGDGIYETPAFCFFGTRVNLIPYGADLGAWTQQNAPTVAEVSGLGNARVWKLTDDSTAQEGIQSPQAASRFTGAGNGVIRTLIGKGTSASPSITLRDVTNNVDRGRLDVAWVGVVPVITPTGASVQSLEVAGKTDDEITMYEVAWKGSGTLTSADHAIIYRAAQSAANQGDVYFGASHLEDAATYPLPMVLNFGAGARTFDRDEWRLPYDGHIGPGSLLLDQVEYGNVLENGVRVVTIGSTALIAPEIVVDVAAGVYRVRLLSPTGSVSSQLTGATMPTVNQRFKLYVLINPEGAGFYSVRISIQLYTGVVPGPWVDATASSQLLMPKRTGYSGYPGASYIQFGHAANNRQSTCLIEGKVALAPLTREQMAAAFG